MWGHNPKDHNMNILGRNITQYINNQEDEIKGDRSRITYLV
jgi:hypothetical protein